MGEDGRNTEDLMRLLNEGALSDVVHAEDLLPTFPNQLARLCAERETARERVIQRAQIERSYGHQLFNGTRMATMTPTCSTAAQTMAPAMPWRAAAHTMGRKSK